MNLDSNVIIYSNQPGYEFLLDWLANADTSFEVSAISAVDVLGYPRLSPQDKIDFTAFFASVLFLPITAQVIQEVIRLRQLRKRSLGDAIITATALIHAYLLSQIILLIFQRSRG